MEQLYWIIIVALFIISYIGLIFPVLPSVLFIVAGFIVYGLTFSFTTLSVMFWVVQLLLFILLFGADYVANLVGIKKSGGSKAAIVGSTIGLLIGPFIIPFLGIIIGPFLGAVIAEIIVHKNSFYESTKIGIGAVIGFLTGVIAKGVLQTIMIVYFFYRIL